MATIMPVNERTERLLERSGRITPREVLAAAERLGIEVQPQRYATCGMGVVTMAAGWEHKPYHYMRERYGERGGSYTDGFITGFDGYEPAQGGVDYRKGYRDGRRCGRFTWEAKR